MTHRLPGPTVTRVGNAELCMPSLDAGRLEILGDCANYWSADCLVTRLLEVHDGRRLSRGVGKADRQTSRNATALRPECLSYNSRIDDASQFEKIREEL